MGLWKKAWVLFLCFPLWSLQVLGEPGELTREPERLEKSPGELNKLGELDEPDDSDSNWVKVGFERTESDLVDLFATKIPEIQRRAKRVLVYQIQLSESIPSLRKRVLREKLEAVISQSNLSLVDCSTCSYVDFSKPESLPSLAENHKVAHGLQASLSYRRDRMTLSVKLVELVHGIVLGVWNVNTEELYAGEFNGSPTDSLKNKEARILLGEVAFRTVVSSGFISLPDLKDLSTGGSGKVGLRPYLGILIGERYDGGQREFGFGLGVSFELSESSTSAEEAIPDELKLPVLIHIGPQMRYVFNPQNHSSAKWILQGELGAMFSTNLSTAYIGVGPEVMMINRFSLGILPMYIFSTEVRSQIPPALGGVNGESSKGATGKFGGMAILLRGNILW